MLNSRLTITGANDDSNGHTLTNEEPTQMSDSDLEVSENVGRIGGSWS